MIIAISFAKKEAAGTRGLESLGAAGSVRPRLVLGSGQSRGRTPAKKYP
jgi:hypothetical protein